MEYENLKLANDIPKGEFNKIWKGIKNLNDIFNLKKRVRKF